MTDEQARIVKANLDTAGSAMAEAIRGQGGRAEAPSQEADAFAAAVAAGEAISAAQQAFEPVFEAAGGPAPSGSIQQTSTDQGDQA